MTTTTIDKSGPETDQVLLYWVTVLSGLDNLQHELTHRATFGLDPSSALDVLQEGNRYGVEQELGSELAGHVTEETVYTWLLRLAPEHSYFQRHGIDGDVHWQKVVVTLQEEPRVTCTWTRQFVSEVLLSVANGGEHELPLPYLKALFEKLWL